MLNAVKYIFIVVDILIVTFIFYKAFMLIRGTRAVQAIKGLGILIAISSIASFGNLQTLDWRLAAAEILDMGRNSFHYHFRS
jgi:diadenylate cyclase